jgi:hypothetical protein
MAIGVELKEIESNLLYIDSLGNCVLNTTGKIAGQVQAGNVPAFIVVGAASTIAITNGVGASSNICNVTFQVVDAAGNAIAGVFLLEVYLSDAATGVGLTATTASGGIAAAASGGTVLDVLVAAKYLKVQTNAAGAFILAITDTAKTLFYPVGSRGSSIVVGAQLTTASYHT